MIFLWGMKKNRELIIKMNGHTNNLLRHYRQQRETTFVNFLFTVWQQSPDTLRSTLKGKNLLHKEQILSLKSCPTFTRDAKMKMAELFPLKRSRSP